jgi:hypothetical protein
VCEIVPNRGWLDELQKIRDLGPSGERAEGSVGTEQLVGNALVRSERHAQTRFERIVKPSRDDQRCSPIGLSSKPG